MTAPARLHRLDLLRGVAMLWMTLYHLAFDLNWFGQLSPRQNFYTDPFWTWQRVAIVSLFLLCAGMSQAAAAHAQVSARRFWRRWLQIAACALLVSLGSAWMFPDSWISFGVLHGIAIMMIVARIAAPLGPWQLLLGLAAVLLPQVSSHAFFDSRWTNWMGLVTHKPVTEDFLPLLPWLGVMLWGQAAGQWILARHPALLRGTPQRWAIPLETLGRWPLTYYLIHQPVLLGAIGAWLALRPG